MKKEIETLQDVSWLVDNRLPCDKEIASGLIPAGARSSITKDKNGKVDSILITWGHVVKGYCTKEYLNNLDSAK